MRVRSIIVVLAVLLGSGTAFARDVYLNGVKLDSNVILKNQVFPACEVKFDADGNVHITAKGFKIEMTPAPNEKADTATPPPADGKLGKRYWLVSKQTKRGVTQYDVDVFLNDVFVKKVKSAEDTVVIEVTKHVKPGANKVRLVAVKNLGEKRISSSAVDVLEIVLGEGNVAGGTVTIDKPVMIYKRNASETGSFKDEASFTGR
jgi:hypothetical protein